MYNSHGKAKSGLYKACILSESALSIGMENDAFEEENALSNLEGIVS